MKTNLHFLQFSILNFPLNLHHRDKFTLFIYLFVFLIQKKLKLVIYLFLFILINFIDINFYIYWQNLLSIIMISNIL